MTVLVDNMNVQYGRMKMCHMIADTHDELIAFAKLIGLNVKWLQNEGTKREHFDVSQHMRQRAIQNGAKAVSVRELASVIQMRNTDGFTI